MGNRLWATENVYKKAKKHNVSKDKRKLKSYSSKKKGHFVLECSELKKVCVTLILSILVFALKH